MIGMFGRLILFAFAAYVGTALGEGPPQPDFSTPRAAAKSFYAAVDACDAASIRQAMLADDEPQRKLVDAFADTIVASQKLASAAKDKFGAAGDSLQTSAIPHEEAARIDKSQEKIDGDDATLELPDRP